MAWRRTGDKPLLAPMPPKITIILNKARTLWIIIGMYCAVFIVMMTSSNGNIFRVPGPLCGVFTGHRWIHRTKASNAELRWILWSVPWINGWVNNREAGDLRRYRAHYDVIVIVHVVETYIILWCLLLYCQSFANCKFSLFFKWVWNSLMFGLALSVVNWKVFILFLRVRYDRLPCCKIIMWTYMDSLMGNISS